MRNPTIHIRMSHFVKILKDIGIKQPQAVAEQIFTKAVPYSILSRYQVPVSAQGKQKIGKVLAAARNDEITVTAFNRILSHARKDAGHLYFKEIRQDDKIEYPQLKDVAALAVDFCQHCNLTDVHDGCRVYLTLGLELMGNKRNQYNLGKFKTYDSRIYAAYESLKSISEDEDAVGTRHMHDLYTLLLMEYAAISRDDLLRPENYYLFILTRDEADKVDANYEDWLRAQFEEMGRMYDKVPELTQLYTAAAVKRYYSYIAEGSRKATLVDEVIRPKQQEDDFMTKYNEKLKSKNK